MNYFKIYFSPTGGTKKTIDIMASEWGGTWTDIDLSDPNMIYEDFRFNEEDICLVAVPSFGGRVPDIAAARLSRMNGNNARAVLICVYGNREYDDTLLELENILCDSDFRAVAAVSSIAEHSIMHKYAKGRPDRDDIHTLKAYTKQIKKAMEENKTKSPVKVPGNKPYRAFGGVPLKPAAGRKCTHCGVCAKKCPIQAISFKDLTTCDAEKCIACMQCIAVCPAHVRKINPVMVFLLTNKMKKAFAEYKKPELFL